MAFFSCLEVHVVHRFETSQHVPFNYKKFKCPSTINKSLYRLCNVQSAFIFTFFFVTNHNVWKNHYDYFCKQVIKSRMRDAGWLAEGHVLLMGRQGSLTALSTFTQMTSSLCFPSAFLRFKGAIIRLSINHVSFDDFICYLVPKQILNIDMTDNSFFSFVLLYLHFLKIYSENKAMDPLKGAHWSEYIVKLHSFAPTWPR